MSDTTREPDPGDDNTDYGDEPAAGVPRWVKVFGIIALVLLALFVVVLASGGGGHGPGRHTGEGAGEAPLSSATDHATLESGHSSG